MRRLWTACLALAGAGLLGTSSCIASGPAESTATEAEALATADASEAPFPPPSTPVEASPLTDQSSNLEDVLEWGTLSESDCVSYFLFGQKDRTTTLRCGKWMFFYWHNEIPGSPRGLVDLIRQNAPQTVGSSLEKLGMIPDPTSKTGMPVGLVPGPDLPGFVKTYTVTCAGCHFGQTPDGRYVAGQPNYEFAFNKYVLANSMMPILAIDPFKKLAPEVEQALGPIRDEVLGNPLNRLAVIGQLLTLIPDLLVTQPKLPDDAALLNLSVNATGVLDPYSPPSIDDGVTAPVKISPLYGIDPDAMTAAGSVHGAMLSSSGGQPDLQHVLRTFAFVSGAIRKVPLGANYDPANVAPLIEYIMSLQAPVNPNMPDPSAVAKGKDLFRQRCFSCHDGPAFAGTAVFDPTLIGTDPNISHMLDPDKTGVALDDAVTPPELTYGVRARRLPGIWAWTRFFHNGSLTSLKDVFCLEGPRPASPPYDGHSTAGHDYTCDGLSTDDKQSLIAFLQSL